MNSQVDKILSMVDCFKGQDADVKKANKKSFIEKVKSILPPQIKNKDRFALMFEEVVNQKMNDPYVSDKSSVLPCVFQAAKFGLYPDPAMGLIYFIPYKGKLTYQIGYKGMIQLAKNAGDIIDIRANLVYKKEVDDGLFNYHEDENGQHFYHKPLFDAEKTRGALYCAYSIAETRSGKVLFHPMEACRIDEIKRMVLARTPKSPWADSLFLPEMQKKTVIRRHCKTLDSSPDLRVAIEYEEAIERGEDVKYNKDEMESVIGEIIQGQSTNEEIKQEDQMPFSDKKTA